MKNDSQHVATLILAGILAIGASLAAGSAYAVPDQPKNWEKCAGIAKAGMNDCGSLDGKHSCVDQANLITARRNGFMFLKEHAPRLPVARSRQ